MIVTPSPSSLMLLYTQYTSQGRSDPTVERLERPLMALFEVFEKATYHDVELSDDCGHAMPVVTLGEHFDLVSKLP
jgi:hypothetical protein